MIMKKRGFFDTVLNKCEKCGRYFGKHDMFEHMMKDMQNGIVKAIENIEKQENNLQNISQPTMQHIPKNEPFVLPNIARINAEVETNKENAVKVYGITPDFWTDYGYWLEAFGFMTYHAMKYQEWSDEKILKFVNDRLSNIIEAHKIKR